jgi:hypothetical protein
MKKALNILIVILVSFGVSLATVVIMDNIKTNADKKHETGEWYYYHLAEQVGSSDTPEITYRRSDNKYDDFESCKAAFLDYNKDVVGGCARDCELTPGSAYALRIRTCKEVVEI